ncbi:MAG: hypothetical protein EBS20_00870 [Actinobacteria bacterium]|nr:hypothetical protein [Actinomycetota bacterium]
MVLTRTAPHQIHPPRRFLARLLVASAAMIAALLPAATVTAQDNDGSDTDVTTVTVNDFVPTERDLSECISAVPKPGCGSEARGGWRQTAIFALVVGGLAFIGWRVVAGARKNLAASNSSAEPDSPT